MSFASKVAGKRSSSNNANSNAATAAVVSVPVPPIGSPPSSSATPPSVPMDAASSRTLLTYLFHNLRGLVVIAQVRYIMHAALPACSPSIYHFPI